MSASLGLALFLVACASKNTTLYQDPCASLRAEIEEKQKLDAQVNALAKQEKKYREGGDTASAVSAAHRLTAMRENQRLMKESLDQRGNDCRAVQGDPLPVRGPSAQDPERRDPLK